MIACLLFNLETWKQRRAGLYFPQPALQITELLILPDYPDWLCLKIEVNEKTPIWQLALELETENIMTGYGFGLRFQEAKDEAIAVLSRRISEQEAQLI